MQHATIPTMLIRVAQESGMVSVSLSWPGVLPILTDRILRDQELLGRCEIVSNPHTADTNERSVRQSGLVIYHHESV